MQGNPMRYVHIYKISYGKWSVNYWAHGEPSNMVTFDTLAEGEEYTKRHYHCQNMLVPVESHKAILALLNR